MVNEYYCRNGFIKVINIRRILALSHFLFVDNFLLFGNSTLREALKFKETFDMYLNLLGWNYTFDFSTLSLVTYPGYLYSELFL